MKIKILLAAAGIVASLAGLYTYHNIAAANNSNKEEIAYRQEMSNLICDIKEYGREHGKGDFFIIANGGAGLMESNEMFPEEDCNKLKSNLDGVMVESVNYGWDMAMDNPTPVEDQEIFHDLLAQGRPAGAATAPWRYTGSTALILCTNNRICIHIFCYFRVHSPHAHHFNIIFSQSSKTCIHFIARLHPHE